MQNQSTRPKKSVKPCPTPPRFAGEMLNVLTDVMSVGSVDAVLQRIADTVAELFSVRTLVIGVLDEHEQLYRVRATYGYEGEREKKIKKFTYTQERLRMDIDDRWKIADNVYLVRPDQKEFVKGEEAFYHRLDRIKQPRTDPAVWHELDYIRFVINDRLGLPIGFIEINEIADDKIPDKSTTEAMEIFSRLAGVAIENATTYQRQVEVAQRSKFLGDIIAHDINNYNQAVTSYLQMARSGQGLSQKAENYLERASSAAWSISEVIQRAHKLMRIEQEGAENLGPMELGEVLKESANKVMMGNPEKAVKFDMKLGSGRYFAMANEHANEIFTNLLENAVTYDPHEKVNVDVTIGEFTVEPRRYWCVSIADNGIGIPDSKKNVVFGRFRTADESTQASGLGLSIVRAIVEAYHGMVWVEDRVPGEPSKGSVFRVALPMTSGG